MSQKEPSSAPQEEERQAVEEAEGRGRLAGLRQRLYGAATREMLEAARLKPGDQVLDIAAGTGDQGRVAARLVGSEGGVLATDISSEMLAVAARLAQQEGLDNITTRVMRAEQLELPDNSYDAAISRLGLMLMPERQQALAELWRVLKPGGRLAALVWSKPERNSLFTLYVERFVRALEDGEADPFSLAEAATFAGALTGAGFRQVQVQAIPLTFQFPSFEALAEWWGSPFKEALARLEAEPRQRLLAEVRQTVRQYEGPAGIVAPGELLLGMGLK
jgi:ubiquinone/menaquinone biosynthesis C-methylase UbiE